jgi:hypothetical protein
MVPSPPSEETSPAVAAEIQRLNQALAAGSTPSTASSDPGPASAFPSRKMLTRKPTPRGLGARVASSEFDDDASTPSKARSLSLKREIDATTPTREVVHRIVTGEEPKGKDAESARHSFADDTAARVSVDSPLSFSKMELLEKERAAEKDLSAEKVVPSRVREYETAESRAALELLENKLTEVERDLQKARREAAETARRAAAVERTNARLRRELLETTASRRSEIPSGKSVHEPPVVDDTERNFAQKQNPDPAALYVDVERLSAELRETKRRLAEANAAAAAADAENKKVFDEMLAAANEVADDLERERARCERAECELGQARAAALARDESRLGEIIEVKSELALAKASLRVAKEKNAGVLGRLDAASEKREGHEDEGPKDALILNDLRLERERLRFELGEARSAAAAAEARANKACSSAAGARAAAALAEAATEAVEARRDSVETKLREDLREARRTLHRATGEGDGDNAGEEEDVPVTTSSTWAARDAAARREKEAASIGGGVGGFPARLTAVLMFALASVLILAFAGLLLVAMSDRRRDARGYECAARWMRASFVDELLSGTLGAPFRRDDVCRVAAPPAT